MPVSEQGVHVVASFEGRALRAYRDEVGVWTIGYGETASDIETVRRILGDPNFVIGAGATITEDQAETLLRASLNEGYLPEVQKRLPNQSQQVQDGGTSFHYNTGAIGRASWVPKWLAGQYEAAGDLAGATKLLTAARREFASEGLAGENEGPLRTVQPLSQGSGQ